MNPDFISKLISENINESIHKDVIIGYHLSKSFHHVRKIFKEGFKDILGAGRLCFCLNLKKIIGWSNDLGSDFIIKISMPFKNFELNSNLGKYATKDHIKQLIKYQKYSRFIPNDNINRGGYLNHNTVGYLDNSESGVIPSIAKPLKWGMVLNKKVYWFGNNPELFNLQKIPENIRKLITYQDVNVSKDVEYESLKNHLTQAYAYDSIDPDDITEKQKNYIYKLLKKYDFNIVKAFKESKLTIQNFQCIFLSLRDNGMINRELYLKIAN